MKDYDDILISLRQITRAIDIHSRDIQKQTGLTTSQVLVLEAIERIETPTPGSVAKEIVLSQATVTNLLDRLEKRGLVRREKMDTDKRSVRLALTAEGLEKIKSSPEILQSEFLAKYRKLDNWERQMLVASLSRVAAMMNAEGIDASPILTSGEIGKN